jgi:hypothetical protein
MQRFSPEIPWVLIESDPQSGGMPYRLMCEVCGMQGYGGLTQAQQFTAAHRVHAAPQGSFRLGDAFAAVAKPVARAFGLEPDCTPCEARRRRMNAVRFR